MSVQENYLKAIAEAIRQKEGSQEAVPAKDFARRILALDTGGESPCPAGGMEILPGWREDRQRFAGAVKMPGIALAGIEPGMEILEGY